ncbi:MAG: nitrophenyl compound nitroreductase subunit ArsF family protein [Candidatus Omnitrophota bacterium]
MNRLFFVLLAATALSIGTILLHTVDAAEDARVARVVAYYFHGTARCPTCHKLEQYSKEAIGDGLKVINVEEKENEHYIKDYQLYTKSLILSLVVNGKETKWKNLDKIWEYAGNKQKFIDYVKNEAAGLLKEAQ